MIRVKIFAGGVGNSQGTPLKMMSVKAQMPWGEFKQSAAAKLGLAVPDHAAASPLAFFRHGIRIEQPDEKPVTLFVRDGDMLTLMTYGSGTKPANSAMKSPVSSPRTLQTSQQGACQSEAYTGFIESCKRQGLKALGNSPSADLDSCVVLPGMSPTRRMSGRISVKVIKREDSFARDLSGAAGGGGGGSMSAVQVLPGVSRSCGEGAVQAVAESSPPAGAFAVGKSVKEVRSSDEGAPAGQALYKSVRMPKEEQKQEEVEEAVQEEAVEQLERQDSDGADGLHFLACAAELLADMEAREEAAGRQQQGRMQQGREEAAGKQQQGKMQQGREEAAGRSALKQTRALDATAAQGVPEGRKVRRLVTTGAADPASRSSARETPPQPQQQQQQAPAAEAAAGVQVAWRCPGTAVTTAVGSPAPEPQVLSHGSSGTEHGSLRSAAWWATGLRGSRGKSPAAASQWPTGSLGVPAINGIPTSGCVGVVPLADGVTRSIPGGSELRSQQHYQGHGMPNDGSGLQIGNVSVSPVRTARKDLPEERLQRESSPSPLDLPPRLSTTASASAAAAAAAGSPDTVACAPVSATAATARLASTSFAAATPLSPRATAVARGRLGAGTFSTAAPMSFGDAGPGAMRSSSAAAFAAMRAGSGSAVSNPLLVSSLRQPTVTSVIGSPFASNGPYSITPNLLTPVSSPSVFPTAGAASHMAVLRASAGSYTAVQHSTPAVHLHHPAPSVTTGTAVARSVKRSYISEAMPSSGQGILDQLKRKRVREEQRHMQEREKQAIHEYVQQQLMKHQPKGTASQDEQQQKAPAAAEPASTSADNRAQPPLQVLTTRLSKKSESQQQQQQTVALSTSTLLTGSDTQQQRMQPLPVQVLVEGQPASTMDSVPRPQPPHDSAADQLLLHSSQPQAQLHTKQAELPGGAEEHLRLQEQQQQQARTLPLQGWVRWGNQQQQQQMHLLADQVGHSSGHSPLSEPALAAGHQLKASMQQLQETQLSMAQDLTRVMQQQQQLQLQQQPRAIVTGDIVRGEAQKGLAPKPMSALREVAQTKALWQLQQQLQQPGDMQQAEHWSLRQHEAQIDAMKRLRLLNKERERIGQEQQQRLQGEQDHKKQLGKQAIQLYVQQQLQKQQESMQQG